MKSPTVMWMAGATLGEGPCWHSEERMLYFVDIKQRRLYRCNEAGGERMSWQAPDEIGFALPLQGGGLVCGLPGRLVRFDGAGGFETLLELEAEQPGNRCNDAYVDAAGRLWFGTMDNGETAPSGSLYRYDGRALTQMEQGIVITNGPCQSPDGKVFYHTDTLARVVYAYDCAADGSLANRREFIRYPGSATGYPDGSTVDAEGNLWVALFGGFRVERYAPDGKLTGCIELPCPNVTKVAFGGADLRSIYITTARKGMDEAALAAYPMAGALFALRSEVPGLPQHQFNRNIT